MTEFQQNTETLRSQLEVGDMDVICAKAGCAKNTLVNAFKRTDANELTNTERKAYEAFTTFVAKRVKEKEQLNKRAAKIAEKIK